MTGLTVILAVSIVTLAAGDAVAQEAAGQSEAKKPDLRKEGGLQKVAAELSRPGAIAVVDLRSGSGILKAARLGERPETKVVPIPPARSLTVVPTSLQEDPVLEDQYKKAFAAIEDCHVEVARRLHVPPAEIAADTVTFRWIVEPSGHARDMQAVAVTATDPAVVLCAERVLASWVLLSPAVKPITLERTYSFRKLPPVDGLRGI